ncbi:MAG TPA: OmpA family protein [Stellaceae bacterium]|nr:OmpA family protein [Stellaceae bacterium]
MAFPPQAARTQPVPLERRATHPDGASISLNSIEFHSDSTIIAATITNPGDHAISLNRRHSFVLEDGGGGVQHLNPPPDNRDLRIPAFSRMTGELVFIGPTAPTARELTLSTNAGIGTTNNPYDDAPTLSATFPVALSGDAAQANHPDGVALRVRSLDVADGVCVVAMIATNGNDRDIRLNQNGDSLRLSDDHGSATAVVPPADNSELIVPPGDRLTGKFVFPCQKIDTAGEVTLVSNQGAGGTPDNPYEMLPVLTLKLRGERLDGAAPPKASQAAIAPIARSHLTASVATLAAAASSTPATAPAPPAAAAPPPTPQPAPAAPAPQPAAAPTSKAPAPAQTAPAPAARTPPAQPPAPATSNPPQVEAELRVSKTDRGLRVIIPSDPLFGASGNTLDPAADPLLTRLDGLVARTHPREIVVFGHTDSSGDDDSNQKLSEQRAHAVVAWLEAHAKLRPHYIEKGYGRTRPVAPNHNADGSDNPDGRAQNRRIEILLRR